METFLNLKDSSRYLFVKRKKGLIFTRYNFYISSLFEVNSIKYRLKNLVFSIKLNNIFFTKTNLYNLSNKNIGKLLYNDENKSWNLIYDNNKLIVKDNHIPKDTTFILTFNVILIKNYTKNINNQQIIESKYPKIIDFYKNKDINKIKDILIKNKNNKPDDICIICFDNLKKNELIETSCNHKFHYKCFEIWYQQKNSCPICRKNMYFDSLFSNDIKIITSDNPKIKNNRPILSFFPIRYGLPSSKNLKLSYHNNSIYKILKINKNTFAVEYKKPLNLIETIGITLINLSRNRNTLT